MSSERFYPNRYANLFKTREQRDKEFAELLASLPLEKAPREQRQNLNQVSN